MDNVALENMTQTDESESAQKNPTSQEFFISAVGRMSDIEYVLSYKDEILKNIKERKIYKLMFIHKLFLQRLRSIQKIKI